MSSAPPSPLPLVILISGRGSNMLAIANACRERLIQARVCGVIADRAHAGGLEAAAALGLPTQLIDRSRFGERQAFEDALRVAIDRWLAAAAPPTRTGGLLVLAGFMRVLSAAFVEHYRGLMLNIHPSLLPQFAGLHTHRRVLGSGASQHGASVHYVTAEVDGGPVVLQSRVAVRPHDTEATLAARVLTTEHIIYPRAIDWVARGRLTWQADQPWLDGQPLTQPVIEDFPA